MRRLKRAVFLLTGLSFCLLYAAEFQQIQRERATLREGPGSFYPAIAELSQGVTVNVLETMDGWHRVQVQELNGYIAGKATEKPDGAVEDAFARMGQQPSVTQVAQSGISAAVKGFAERFTQRLDADTTLLSDILSYRMDPVEYQAFKEDVYAGRNLARIRRQIDLPRQKEYGNFSFSEEGVGLAIATKLASMGLLRMQSVQDYVNAVGNLVVEASGAYQIPFKFYVLESEKVNAYSCPGGLVFLTSGALQRIQDEAELACFLGHEVAHVALRHGMREMEKRKVMITADNAFMELESETSMSEDLQETSAELEDIALESYETIFAGRLEQYEQVADEYGLICAARAGYAPGAMIDLLARLSGEEILSGNQHYTPGQNADRHDRIRQWVQSRQWPTDRLIRNRDSYLNHLSGFWQRNTD